jgi:hypothetical protein
MRKEILVKLKIDSEKFVDSLKICQKENVLSSSASK